MRMRRRRLAAAQLALLLLAAGFCFSVSLTFLPFLPIRPQKFALMFSLGSVRTPTPDSKPLPDRYTARPPPPPCRPG